MTFQLLKIGKILVLSILGSFPSTVIFLMIMLSYNNILHTSCISSDGRNTFSHWSLLICWKFHRNKYKKDQKKSVIKLIALNKEEGGWDRAKRCTQLGLRSQSRERGMGIFKKYIKKLKKDCIKGLVRHTLEPKFELIKKNRDCFEGRILKQHVRRKILVEIYVGIC